MSRYFDSESAPFEHSLPSPDCTLIAPLLTAYFDLEAPGTEAVRVQHHLSNCARCAQMWRDWGDTRALLQSTPVPAPPYTLAAEIVQTSRLTALLPSAPLSSELSRANAHDEIAVPPQLQETILAATTRSAVISNHSNHGAIADDVVTQHDFFQPLRRAKPWVAMAAVPALALWLITLTASDSSLFVSQDSPDDVAISASPKPALSQAPFAQNAQPLIAQTKSAPTTFAVPAQQRSIAPFATQTVPAQKVKNDDSLSSELKARPADSITLAQWPTNQTSAPVVALTAPMMTISLRSPQPLAASAPAIKLRTAEAKSVKTTTVAAPQSASRVRTAAVSRAVTPRRSAKLSTVSMATPALSSAMLTRPLPLAGETTRVAMRIDALSAQKATLPVASSRESSDDALWQSDVAPGRSALSVVQALNDNRPSELRDAFDAYAQTLMDDGDISAATL